MTDSLSTTTDIIDIVVPVLHGTRLLLDDLQKLVEASKVVASLKEDLHSLDIAFEALKVVQNFKWKLLD